ncbi:glucokinase, partial [Salmonella enterica]|uniref:glucokinase n=1 Tax=Salmonella enterica TaxID=28901 RepID=UPI00398C2584
RDCPIPVAGVAITNTTGHVPITEKKKNVGMSQLESINDFTAVPLAITILRIEHVSKFGGGEPVDGEPMAVYGAGTGVGVEQLLHVDKRSMSLPGQGGQVYVVRNTQEEDVMLEMMRADISPVSRGHFASGLG